MSGNCATGSALMAIRPAIEMTVEMTNASRGRRMKTEEMVIGSALLSGPRPRAAVVGFTVMPARTLCWPWTMTFSPAFSSFDRPAGRRA